MRKWINLFESQQFLINIVEDYGSVEGYVTSDSSIISNWFMHRHDVYDQQVIEAVQEYENVAFLNNINVNEEARGKGFGNKLLNEFEHEATGHYAQVIVLFGDINESQVEGFDLVKWYESNGYEEVHPSEGLLYCPLLMKVL